VRRQKAVGFEKFVRKKEKEEMADEQNLMNLFSGNNPVMKK